MDNNTNVNVNGQEPDTTGAGAQEPITQEPKLIRKKKC